MPKLPPPPPPPTTVAALPALEEANAKYATLDEAQHHALLHGYIRYIERPRASLRAVWESEAVGAEDDAPFIRDIMAWEYFQTHATRMRWRARRKDHWIEVRSAVERGIKDEQVQRTLAELGTLDAAEGALLEYILGNPGKGIDPIAPKSLEGAVGALVKLDERRDKKRTMVIDAAAAAAQDVDTEAAQLTSDSPGGAVQGILTGGSEGFTDDEIEAMAIAQAEHFVADMTARLQGDSPEDAAEEAMLRAELIRGDGPRPSGITVVEDENEPDEEESVSVPLEGKDDGPRELV